MRNEYVALFQIGLFYESARTTKIFSSVGKAMEHIPRNFQMIPITEYDYYAENKNKGEWLIIKRFKVE